MLQLDKLPMHSNIYNYIYHTILLHITQPNYVTDPYEKASHLHCIFSSFRVHKKKKIAL